MGDEYECSSCGQIFTDEKEFEVHDTICPVAADILEEDLREAEYLHAKSYRDMEVAEEEILIDMGHDIADIQHKYKKKLAKLELTNERKRIQSTDRLYQLEKRLREVSGN